MSSHDMEDLFKNALDRPSAPVSHRVWSSIQAHLPIPWYKQAWIGWLFALLSSLGTLGLAYHVWDLKTQYRQFTPTSTVISRIDTVYVSRIDTIYVLQQPSRFVQPQIVSTSPTRAENFPLQSPGGYSPNREETAMQVNVPAQDTQGESQAAPVEVAPKRAEESELVMRQSRHEIGVGSSENTPSPADESPSKTAENDPEKTKADINRKPLTSDLRMFVSPSASVRGSWAMQVGMEWEIRQKWGVGLGLQGDFFPEIEYDRVADFVRVYGKNPSQVYPELANIPTSSQNLLEDIEIQRTVFSVPIYTRYYVPIRRGWRWYPEIGYRLSVRTRERVDVDIDSEEGPNFRLFTARNPTQSFSKAFIGGGLDWQSRGWTFQVGTRWVNQEGLSFQMALGKTLLGKSKGNLWRF